MTRKGGRGLRSGGRGRSGGKGGSKKGGVDVGEG